MRDRYMTGYALGVQAIPSLFAATLSVACVSIAAAFALDLDKVGLLFLAGNGGAFLSFLLGGYLCDRIGRGRVLLWGGGICVAGSALCATAPSLVVLVFGAFMIGVGGGSLALAGIALLNDLHQERRRMVIASSQLVASSASFLGPIAVGYLIQCGETFPRAFGHGLWSPPDEWEYRRLHLSAIDGSDSSAYGYRYGDGEPFDPFGGAFCSSDRVRSNGFKRTTPL